MIRRREPTESSTDALTTDPDGAAERLGLGRTMTYSLIKSGELRSVKVGRRRLIPLEAIAEFLDSSRVAPESEWADVEPIEVLDLPWSSFAPLKRQAIRTLADLDDRSDDVLLQIRGIGVARVEELRDAVRRYRTKVNTPPAADGREAFVAHVVGKPPLKLTKRQAGTLWDMLGSPQIEDPEPSVSA